MKWTDFYNELIQDNYDVEEDYINWKSGAGFSFHNYPFIVDAGVKAKMLENEYASSPRVPLTCVFLGL